MMLLNIWKDWRSIKTFEKLVRDGFATEEPQEHVTGFGGSRQKVTERYGYFISFEGIQFCKSGGYKELREKEKEELLVKARREDLQTRQIQSTISASSIQKYTFIVTVLSSLAALSLSLFGYLKEKPNIINPAIILQDTLLELKSKDTIQLRLELNTSSGGDTTSALKMR